MNYFDQLRRASYRDIPFGVFGGQIRVGRRNAIHEYPYRDTVWVEDLGRQARRIVLVGFLVGDDAIAKRERLVGASESGGDGQLVHPTLGALIVSLLDLEISESWEHGRVFELRMTFVEAGQRVFPDSSISTTAQCLIAASQADHNSLLAYAMRVDQALRKGAAVIAQAKRQVQLWVVKARKLVSDAVSLYHTVVSLPGELGRYFSNFGTNILGDLGIKPGGASANGNLPNLIAQGAKKRQAADAAAVALGAAAGEQSSGNTAGFATAAQALAASVLNSAADPADAVRLLEQLANFTPAVITSTAPIGAAIATMADACGDLFRRAAVVALARASTTYQPTSYNDAAALRTTVCALLDAEILIAADQGEDDVYASLRALRVAVSNDLTARGADLATVTRYQLAASLPSLVVAQRLYRDPARAGELVRRTNPVHPAFMPTHFQALSE